MTANQIHYVSLVMLRLLLPIATTFTASSLWGWKAGVAAIVGGLVGIACSEIDDAVRATRPEAAKR